MPPKRPRPPPDDPVWDLVERYGDFSDPELALLTPPPTEDAPRRTLDADRLWPQAGPASKKKKLKEGESEPERRLKIYKKGEQRPSLHRVRLETDQLRTAVQPARKRRKNAQTASACSASSASTATAPRPLRSSLASSVRPATSTPSRSHTSRVATAPMAQRATTASTWSVPVNRAMSLTEIDLRSCFSQLFVLLKGSTRLPRCSDQIGR